jgi:hypothetical protein
MVLIRRLRDFGSANLLTIGAHQICTLKVNRATFLAAETRHLTKETDLCQDLSLFRLAFNQNKAER